MEIHFAQIYSKGQKTDHECLPQSSLENLLVTRSARTLCNKNKLLNLCSTASINMSNLLRSMPPWSLSYFMSALRSSVSEN